MIAVELEFVMLIFVISLYFLISKEWNEQNTVHESENAKQNFSMRLYLIFYLYK